LVLSGLGEELEGFRIQAAAEGIRVNDSLILSWEWLEDARLELQRQAEQLPIRGDAPPRESLLSGSQTG